MRQRKMTREVIKFILVFICLMVSYLLLGWKMFVGLFAILLALGISLY